MNMATTYVMLEGYPLKVDYHPHRVRQAGKPILNPVPKDLSVGAGTLEAQDVAVVDTIEPETLAPDIVGNSR